MVAEKLVRTNLSFKGQAVNRGSRHSSQDKASELLVGRKSVGRQLPTADRDLVNWQVGSLSLGGPRRRQERSTPFESSSQRRRRAPSYPRASCVYVQICASAPSSNDGITTLTA